MTALLTPPRTQGPAASAVPTSPGRLARARGWLSRHRTSASWLTPLLVLTAVARLVNMGGSPQRIDDEGTYVAQAWAVETLGELGHYTYWYDHPPLGWIQIAGWTALTDGFGRYSVSVLAGREAMVVAATVSAALLWVLGRRLGLSRPAAATALLLFALSPLVVQYSRTVYLDNVATPWVLAAFVLALSRRHQLVSFAAAALCFAVAVLTKETTLLLLPFLVWQLLRSATPDTRRYTLSVAGALFVLAGVGYLALALLKGELLPGAGRVSLWDGIYFQLVGRDSSGSVLSASTQAGQSLRTWLDLGAPLLLGGTAAAAGGLLVRRLRPYAAAFLVLAAIVLKPGYLPVPYVIALLPLAALLVPAVVEAGLRHARGSAGTLRRTAAGGLAGVLALAVLAGAALTWPSALGRLWTADDDAPLRSAEAWVEGNLTDGQRILVDDAAWLDLVRAGIPREDVVWYYKADTDPAVYDLAPDGWSDYDYALVTEGVRQAAGSSPVMDSARDNGVVVASFGDGGPETVDVVRVMPDGIDAFYAAQDYDERARTAAGRQLLDNPALSFSQDAARALRRGTADARSVLLLAQLSADFDLTVGGFPVAAGESTDELPAHRLLLTGVDGGPLDSAAGRRLAAQVRAQTGSYAPASVEETADGLLVTFPLGAPDYLLPAP
ncbi:ArnT family glycosyltransferase [Nocardioides bruguierae]|uniref:Glycosyltransferase family 39 protein n=1 Tax=Nocardioides bruguierae TaxID=2945102 RepID=A0A9X2D7H5_9ACTN|nr:glycosyltransferase family 39 protein [Nocardioides bruguierae]MCM0620596.1 glycosyltransferase family 39 protein [Nocardioides bruguierae]